MRASKAEVQGRSHVSALCQFEPGGVHVLSSREQPAPPEPGTDEVESLTVVQGALELQTKRKLQQR